MTPQTSVIRPSVACGRDPARLPRLLPDGFGAGPMSLHDHLVRYGPPGPQARSRRGAGFPTARKLAAVAARRHAIVVGNGTEGEPASAKDKVLMAQSPHLVLDGAAAAAYLVGAPEAIIAAHSAVSDIVSAAIWERRQARLDRVRLSVVPASDRFVGGEASAVVHWLQRGIPKPKATVRRLSERGLHGRPTLVQNVETLAHLALITRYGAGWFRAVGTASEPGSMLVTLAGAVRHPGVYEVTIGMPVGKVLGLGGGPSGPLGALLIGGYFGSWVDPARATALPFSSASRPRRGRRRRTARRAAHRRLRAGRDRQDRSLPGHRIRRAVRTLRLRPGRDRGPARAARRWPRTRPGQAVPLDRADRLRPGGLQASGRHGRDGGERTDDIQRRD